MMASPLQGLIRPEEWDYMRECLDVTSCRISMWKFGGLEFKGSSVWGQLVASIILSPSLVSPEPVVEPQVHVPLVCKGLGGYSC